MSETTISVNFIKNKIDQKQGEKILVQFGCSMCGGIFHSEKDCDEHITNCVQNTLSARDPLELTSITDIQKAHKRKLIECRFENDPVALFENFASEDSLKNDCEYKKIKGSDLNLKQEENVTLESALYGATSQMLSDNEMLITLPYDQGNESIERPLGFSNEVAIGFEEHTQELNDLHLEYRANTFDENEVKNSPGGSNTIIIENYDVDDSNNIENESTINILSVFTAKEPQKVYESNNVNSCISQENTVSIDNNVQTENDSDIKILTVLNTVKVNACGFCDKEDVTVIDISTPTEGSNRESGFELSKEIQLDKVRNLKKSEVKGSKGSEERKKNTVSTSLNEKPQTNKTESDSVLNKEALEKNISTKIGLVNSENLNSSVKEKLTQTLKSNQNKEAKIRDKCANNNEENRRPQNPGPPQKPEESQNKKEQWKHKMYKEIVKHEKKDPVIPNQFSVYEFFDEEEEKLKEKLKENLAKEKALRARTCRFCNKVFEDPMDVLRHKRQSHKFRKINMTKEELEPYLNVKDQRGCPLCFKELSQKGYKSIYLKHLMTHCDEYNFECRVCGMQFRRKDHWVNHESRHVVTPENPQQN